MSLGAIAVMAREIVRREGGFIGATAGDDIRSLRILISGRRDAKPVIVRTFAMRSTLGVLSALAAGA